MTDKVMLEGNVELSEELMNIDDGQFKIVKVNKKIVDENFKTESISYIKDVWKRFTTSRVSVVAASIISLIVILATVGPSLNSFGYLDQNIQWKNLPPRIQGIEKLGIFDGSKIIDIPAKNLENYADSYIETVKEFTFKSRGKATKMLSIKVNAYILNEADDVYYWFGSDSLGRDLFTRVWKGTRVSLILAFGVVAINLSIGLAVGAIAGYYGGWVDYLIQRFMEIINAIPRLPLAILLIMYFGSGIRALMLTFVITGWISMAYSVRIQFYRFKKMEYALASRTMGARDRRVMYKHILPNAAGTLITVCALTVPSVIFQEAGLSYLGLGIQAPEPSLGTLLHDGQKALLEYPYIIVSSGVVIVLLMLAFNLFSNGLRDAFNPTLRQ